MLSCISDPKSAKLFSNNSSPQLFQKTTKPVCLVCLDESNPADLMDFRQFFFLSRVVGLLRVAPFGEGFGLIAETHGAPDLLLAWLKVADLH